MGVARALAVDPPVMLMDEPFGAVDPIVRERLQDELLRLQEQLARTILFVTHDIDEAIRLGDVVAVFQAGGILAQFDTPDAILGAPASEFVARFVGTDRGLKRLSLSRVSRPRAAAGGDGAPSGDDAAEARARVLADPASPWLLLLDGDGRPLGWVHERRIPASRRPDGRPRRPDRGRADAPDVAPRRAVGDARRGRHHGRRGRRRRAARWAC